MKINSMVRNTLLALVLVCLISTNNKAFGLQQQQNHHNKPFVLRNAAFSALQSAARKTNIPLTTPSVLLMASASTSSVEEKKGETTTEEWTKKRLHNTQTFRGVAILGALVAAGLSSKNFVPNTSSAAIHMLSFATWFGTVAYTTFVAGITMFQNLPKRTFGKLQSKLFPKYFALCSSTLVWQLVTLRSLGSIANVVKSQRALGVALVVTLINQFYLEPKSTDNMFERYKMEDDNPNDFANTDEYKKLKSSFGKFHGMSSLLNLIALCGGVVHALYLASALV